MDFINETGCAADILRSEHKGDSMANALFARARYRLDGQRLVLLDAAEQHKDIRRKTEDLGEHGELSPDAFYPPMGTDVIVLGDAVAIGEPVATMRVEVSVAPYHVVLNVFGDRNWETPSRAGMAKAFSRMPLTYGNAFGGVVSGPHGDVPWQNNPLGKGCYLTPEAAVGNPLANIESPVHRVGSWEDRPDPVGLCAYPKSWGLRLMRLFTFDHAIQKLDLRPDAGMFSQAHPALSGRRIEGNEVRITGMSASGIIRFEMPKCPFDAVIALGDLEYVRGLDPQEIVVDLRRLAHDSAIVDILYRKMFVYEFVPLKIRRTILRRQLSRG